MLVYLPIFALFSLMVFGILMLAYYFRNQLSTMKSMMITMSLAMIVGTDVGSILGMLYPTILFNVTVIAILVGSVIGFIAGLPHGLIAVLNGFISGAMGGMMGAMLGTMFPIHYIDDAFQIMAILSSVIIFINFLIIQEEIKQVKNKWLLFIGKPEMIFMVIALFLFVSYQTSFSSIHVEATPSTPVEITIEATEYRFTPELIRVKAGQMITLKLHNKGTLKHEYEVEGVDIEIHASPGKVEQTTFSIDKPGTYEVVCDLPGHEEAGMVGKIVVE